MRCTQFNINIKRICAILMALVCIPLFSFLSNINNLIIQDIQIPYTVQEADGATQHSMIPKAYKTFMADIDIKDTDFHQITRRLSNEQQLSSRKNNNFMMGFLGLSYRFSFFSFSCLIYLFGRIICKFKHHLVVPHSIHAPPIYSCLKLSAMTLAQYQAVCN